MATCSCANAAAAEWTGGSDPRSGEEVSVEGATGGRRSGDESVETEGADEVSTALAAATAASLWTGAVVDVETFEDGIVLLLAVAVACAG